jgi:hypothetical protein
MVIFERRILLAIRFGFKIRCVLRILFVFILRQSSSAWPRNVRQISWRSHSIFFFLALYLLYFLGNIVGNVPLARTPSAPRLRRSV